jgi:formin 2
VLAPDIVCMGKPVVFPVNEIVGILNITTPFPPEPAFVVPPPPPPPVFAIAFSAGPAPVLPPPPPPLPPAPPLGPLPPPPPALVIDEPVIEEATPAPPAPP